eukprot:TRINITY_DN25867_c0_g1_i1.p2 TRINITY_DN25867_c0_g1~~TRINITY_DN25867_c0_g1_i1.p2  ORF type:complete len:122 (+),score=16.28 TRINITY_DN25867_c0_g1_i1:68-433(+)
MAGGGHLSRDQAFMVIAMCIVGACLVFVLAVIYFERVKQRRKRKQVAEQFPHKGPRPVQVSDSPKKDDQQVARLPPAVAYSVPVPYQTGYQPGIYTTQYAVTHPDEPVYAGQSKLFATHTS